MKSFIPLLCIIFILFSCKTVDLEAAGQAFGETAPDIKSADEEDMANEKELHSLYVEEEMKVQDVEDTVIYVEKPVYIPYEEAAKAEPLKGTAATKESERIATVKPEHYKAGTFYYHYNPNFVYEIYCQPYHLTDIALEDGEVVLGDKVLLSEDESVWELTANKSRNPETGEEKQHFFLKPAYPRLDSTMIVITDRRVYHFRLKSFSDTHMAMVRFTYPMKNIYTGTGSPAGSSAKGTGIENEFMTVTNPEFLSFDYKIKHSIFRKPEFLPTRVYDDGQKTYIHVNEIVLHKQLPVLFNEKNEIINYTVKKNVFIIPRLISKVTLRLGKEKVVIEKKKSEDTDLSGNAEIGETPVR